MTTSEQEELNCLNNDQNDTAHHVAELDDDIDYDTDDDVITPKPTKKGPSPKNKINDNIKKAPLSVSVSSRNLVKQMDKKNHCCLCGCCNHKCYAQFIATLIVTGSILYALISIMTPIAAIISGQLFNEIFHEKYTASEINAMCNDKFEDIFVWNEYDLGTHGKHMYVFGICDLVFILCFACLCSWFMTTYTNKQLNWTLI